MPEYKFTMIHNGEIKHENIKAPNPQVANLRFMSYLLQKRIVDREIIVGDKTMKSYGRRSKSFQDNTNYTPYKDYAFRKSLNNNIKKQLMNNSRNRKRSMASVLTDNDSGKAFQY